MSTPEFVRKAIQGLGFQSDELAMSKQSMRRQAGPAVVRNSGANRWNWRNELKNTIRPSVYSDFTMTLI